MATTVGHRRHGRLTRASHGLDQRRIPRPVPEAVRGLPWPEHGGRPAAQSRTRRQHRSNPQRRARRSLAVSRITSNHGAAGRLSRRPPAMAPRRCRLTSRYVAADSPNGPCHSRTEPSCGSRQSGISFKRSHSRGHQSRRSAVPSSSTPWKTFRATSKTGSAQLWQPDHPTQCGRASGLPPRHRCPPHPHPVGRGASAIGRAQHRRRRRGPNP